MPAKQYVSGVRWRWGCPRVEDWPLNNQVVQEYGPDDVRCRTSRGENIPVASEVLAQRCFCCVVFQEMVLRRVGTHREMVLRPEWVVDRCARRGVVCSRGDVLPLRRHSCMCGDFCRRQYGNRHLRNACACNDKCQRGQKNFCRVSQGCFHRCKNTNNITERRICRHKSGKTNDVFLRADEKTVLILFHDYLRSVFGWILLNKRCQKTSSMK